MYTTNLLKVELVGQLSNILLLRFFRCRNPSNGTACSSNSLTSDSFCHTLGFKWIVDPHFIELEWALNLSLGSVSIGIDSSVSSMSQLD